MASRRGTLQRDGSGKSWTDHEYTSPSPKVSRMNSISGLITPLASLDFPLLSSRLKSAWADIQLNPNRPTRSLERPRLKCMSWKKVLFHIFFSFMVGILLGFAPFSIDIHAYFPSGNERMVFDKDLTAKSIEDKLYSVHQDLPFIDKSHRGNNLLVNEVERIQVTAITPPEKKPQFTTWGVKDYNREVVDTALSVNASDITTRKLLIIVTATSVQPLQAYYLHRLVSVLKAVPPPLLWIVVDWPKQSSETAGILRTSGIMYRHHACNRNLTSIRKVDICQKNTALFEIKKHQYNGIVYFADEDRVYSAELFEEMRKTRRFGTWPVAFYAGVTNGLTFEGPLCKGDKVIGWQASTSRGSSRRFPVHYSAFAFNSTILWDFNGWRQPTKKSIILRSHGKEGQPESRFIERLVEDERQMEGLASNCSKVMVWNAKLESHRLDYPEGWLLQDNLQVVIPIQ